MKNSLRFTISRLLLLVLGVACLLTSPAAGQSYRCVPTPEDEMGPFYRPDAPPRNTVGSGYLLLGTVKSASDCGPIASARIELWMTGPHGQYGDDWRATLFTADNGRYFFESPPPTEFGSRLPHIHIRVSAEGFAPLVTQHYPLENAGIGQFDLVLVPLAKE